MMTAQTKAEGCRVALRYGTGYTLYDAMARKGACQLWEVDATGVLRLKERR